MLQIRKLSNKTWKHVDSIDGAFILTKFYAKEEFNEFLIVESYGAKRRKYLINEIEVYDIGGTAETFANFEDLFLRLEALKYTGFYQDGDIDLAWGSITGTLSDQTDLQTALDDKQDILGFTPENVANKENTTLDTSTTKYPTNRLVKEAIDALQDNTHRNNFYVMASMEQSGLLFDGITAINRFTEIGTRSFISPTGSTRLLSLYFQNYLSATTAGANAGIKQINNADGIYRQGFDNYFVFGNNDANANCQTTVGHYSLLSATMPNTAISSFTGDFVGVGNDVGDTNLSFYAHRILASGQTASYTKVSCGASFPAHDTSSAYLLRMEAPQTETDANRFVKLTITNLITGATATHTFPYTETPVLDRPYATTVIRSNRNTGVATNIKFGKIQVIRKMF